jgi:hypothetical protein
MSRRTRLVGQASLGLASLLFVGSAAAVAVGRLSVEASTPLVGVALCCLVGGGVLARPR